MTRQVFRERECVHRDEGAEGEFYNGAFYVQALQRLQVDDAVQIARRVSSFFWADASNILVWLCNDCAGRLRLTDTPRAITARGEPEKFFRLAALSQTSNNSLNGVMFLAL
jgi:hypothetical protein